MARIQLKSIEYFITNLRLQIPTRAQPPKNPILKKISEQHRFQFQNLGSKRSIKTIHSLTRASQPWDHHLDDSSC